MSQPAANMDFPQSVLLMPPEGDSAQPTEKGAVVQVEKSGRSRGRSQSLEGKVTQVENEKQKRAFAFYYSLGPERTLAKVAEMFGYAEGTIKAWSAFFGWNQRLKELARTGKLHYIRDELTDIVKMMVEQMRQPDPDNPGQKMPTVYATSSKVKDMVAVAKILFDMEREEQEASRRPGEGARGLNGVMVNVIIKK